MKKSIVFALLLLAIIPNAQAENNPTIAPPGNWNKVQTIPPNTSIIVEMRYAEVIEGEFIRLAGDSIIVKEFGREKTFPKSAVAKVKWMRPGSRARNAAIAGGIFFGIGFGLGFAAAPNVADRNNMPAGERVSTAAAVGGFVGGVAAAISLARHAGPHAEVIYRAK